MIWVEVSVRTGIGQDSHRFLPAESAKPCVLAGVIFESGPGFSANSDGDVIYHALCRAISSVTNVPILGAIADDLCLKDGITDSAVYVQRAVETLRGMRVTHAAFSFEGKRPKIKDKELEMRQNVAQLLGIEVGRVGLTASTGEGLTDFGCGDGVQCLCILTVEDQ